MHPWSQELLQMIFMSNWQFQYIFLHICIGLGGLLRESKSILCVQNSTNSSIWIKLYIVQGCKICEKTLIFETQLFAQNQLFSPLGSLHNYFLIVWVEYFKTTGFILMFWGHVNSMQLNKFDFKIQTCGNVLRGRALAIFPPFLPSLQLEFFNKSKIRL